MEFKIRNIQKHDKDNIFKLIEAVNREDNLGYSLTGEWLDYVIQKAGQGIFLAFYGDELAALATAMINPVYKDQAALNVVVAPEFRNRGLGFILYNKIYEFARLQDVKIVETYVKERLIHGVEFAENRGFNTTMYSWEMEVSLDSTEIILDRQVDLNFRKAKEEDKFNYKKIIYDGFNDNLDENSLIQVLKDSSIIVYILEKQGKAIGSATVQIRPDLSLAYIYDIAILKNYRGKGLGSYLIKSCLEDLKKTHIETASLLVTETNKNALELYKKIGFKEVDIDFIMTKEIEK